MRRRAAFQRTLDESRTYQDALTNLLDRIRDGPPGSLDSLTDFIHRGGTNQEAMNAIQELLGPKLDDDDDDLISSQSDGVGPSTDGRPSNQPSRAMSFGDYSAAHHGKSKERGMGFMPVSQLLASLKTCSASQGEAMLRNFMSQRLDEGFALPPWTPAQANQWDGSGSGDSAPTAAERASWHPVLHLKETSNQSQVLSSSN
jgi:hypothetical protein